MNNTTTAVGLLGRIAQIQRMEPGKLCVIGQGKGGPYYNLQCREGGKPVSRYVPQDQVETVRQNTENYRAFRFLVDEYAQTVIARTRQERQEGQKKRSPRTSSSSRTKKSNS
jgi:hypothetical protein